MPVESWRVLITGASSGIGRSIALELASRGTRLVLLARRQDRLVEVAEDVERRGGQAVWAGGDITQADTRREALRLCRDRLGGLDVLVNNAGIGAIGPFALSDSDRLRRIMEVNFFAPAELIRDSLPLLRESRWPIIVNIGSVLGHRAVPRKSEYCASKFALHGFSDALRAELAAENIQVTLISPSTTSSEFFDNVLEGRDAAMTVRGMPADAVARKTVRAMERRRHEVILSAGGKMLVWLDRLFPTLTNHLMARYA